MGQFLHLAVHPPGSDPLTDDSTLDVKIPAHAIAWIEKAPDILGCLLHLVDGTVLQTAPVHGDPDEMVERLELALAGEYYP